MTASWIAVVHRLPERTRLRSPALRHDPIACELVADTIAAIPGVREVKVRPYTGSILILHDREVSLATLESATCRALGCDRILAIGEQPPIDKSVPAFSSVARKLVAAVREIDRDIRRVTDGSVDLGTLATLGFFGAGVAEVVASRELPLPPWFNLAWWGFRTFTTTHPNELGSDEPDA